MPWPSMKAIMSSFMLVRSSGMGDILGSGNGCKFLLYAVRGFGASIPAANSPYRHGLQLGKGLLVLRIFRRQLNRLLQRLGRMVSIAQFQVDFAHLVVGVGLSGVHQHRLTEGLQGCTGIGALQHFSLHVEVVGIVWILA